VADEITRILALPHGQRPPRSVVDFTDSHVDTVNHTAEAESRDFLTRLGYAQLLHVAAPAADTEGAARDGGSVQAGRSA
jgi:hypothetical protein